MEPRPFQLMNNTTQEVLGEYSSQGKVLQGFYDWQRCGGDPSILTMLYIDPETEEMTLFGYGADPQWQRWFDDLQRLTLNLKLCGTDIIGLGEFLSFNGYDVSIEECECPPQQFCAVRYVAWITEEGYDAVDGAGSTALAAMASAYVALCETRKHHGRAT